MYANTSLEALSPSEANFGPSATGRFGFTLMFENAILSILPSAVFFLLAPQRLFWLAKQPHKVVKSPQSMLKLGLIGIYAILQLVVLLYWAVGPRPTLGSQIAAAVFVFVNGFLLLFVSHAEHTRSVKPSTLINVYLVLTLTFDCAIVRTSWLLDGAGVIAKLYTCTAVIKFIVLTVEAWEKRSILLAEYRHLSPEVTSGILGRSVFWWLNPLMKAGFGRVLTVQDLYPIHDDMAGGKLLLQAQKSWGSANQSKKNSLFWSTIWATKYVFLSGMLSRLCLIGFKYAQPFLIHRTTDFTGDLSQPDEVGWGLTGAWIVVFLGLAISNGFYYHMTYRFVTSVRGSLCSMIYSKTLELSVTALDESSAVTLMSTDSELICTSFVNLHEVWASPVECGVALYLLYRQLGLAFLAPMVVSIVATLAIMQLAKYIGNARKKWVRGIQTRVDVTASTLGSMKEVKMLGLTDVLNKMVQDLRVRELKLSKDYRKLLSANSSQTIAPLATFATFVVISQSTGRPLDVASAYSSLSLIYLLSEPMNTVIRTIPMVSSALACFDRIRTFLLSESCSDHRLPLNGSSSSGVASLDKSIAPTQDNASVELQNLGQKTSPPPGAPLMVISEASFGWTSAEPSILSNISCTIRKSHFTFIIGNVGSGKSTLMKAMLGEIRPSKGFVYTETRNIAFVGQEPWIQNLTIRQNILGISSYNEEWYNKVIRACGLEQDIIELPNKDATKAGSAGVSLSGGQKQRLALARAVYSRESVVFLDDVFAGQDAVTEEHIYQTLFAGDGLFREMGTTVICITKKVIHRLAFADHVIALDERGHILHQGSFEQLQSDTEYLHGLDIKQNGAPNAEDRIEPPTINLPTAPRPRTVKDEQPESPKRFLGELATYGYYFSSVPWWHTLLLAAFVTLYGGGFKMTELLLSFWTGRAAADQSTNSFYLGLYGMLAGVALLGIVGGAYFFLIIMVPTTSEVLHARLLKSVMEAPLAFFSKTDVGVVTNRFSQDMSVVDTELPYTLIDLGLNVAVSLMAAILMCVFSGYFAATLPPLVFFCWLLQKFYLKTSRAFKDKYLELLDASQRPYYLLFCIQRWLALVLDIMVAILAAILMVSVVELRSKFSPQFVALALLNVTSFSQFLALVIQGWTQLETSFGAVARVQQFCGETQNENLPTEISPVPENWPSHGHITLENLTASYEANAEPVLHNVTLDIPAGSKVGICGRSGSGKSSLVACLLRMLEISPDSHISFDGIDIATLPRQAVRAAMAVVPQHPFFLKRTTIRQNLVPRGGQSDERILSALQRLKMADVVERMGGLDSLLEGEKLSLGQRQLLCLARAMLSDKRIILLDEASSNVDERSEKLIRQVIREEFTSCTVIAIVHRLGAVTDFDRVAVMSSGRVLEWDRPQALLERDSEFRRLWGLSSS
ncbi:P-loop containing nucleoside triphosphate hydrolase protein [Diplogelasinospora grovesii]|uniref:P-loop containing nucleoside triphosphate hydrolase protein n=1 Tax=Diplogelasinospora grovesii TaxID=303347 RepID=A0AAN6S6T9_9PEZI|nr:P-loop containing nucleoside triphosphate hydrolase protein [Diplogelasinospora grovesii]